MLHRFLATTAFSAFVIGTHFFPTDALAKDPEHYFYPKNKWAVERAESTNNKELHSCTISNQLNNGYRVQIAGTANGFTNINLDLRQNVFETGKRYEVVYQVPGVQEEILPTRAFQKNLLVSDLRQKADFVQAMRESGVLDVNIRGNEFRIYLTGFDAKMQSFSQCVEPEMGMAKAVAEPKDTNVAQASDQIEIIEKSPEPPPSSELTSVTEAKDPLAKPAPRERFTEQIEKELIQESEKYRPEESKMTDASEPEVLIKEPAEIIAPKKKPFIKTKKTKVSFDSDFTKPREEASAKRLQTIEPASGAVQGRQINQDYQALKAEMDSLREQVTRLKKQNIMLDEELRIVSEDSKAEYHSVSTENWNLERATMRFEEAERQTLRLGRQLKTERARCDMEKKELETLLFDPQLTSKTQIAKLAGLEADLEESQTELLRQKRRYEERIRLLEEQLNAQ